MSPWDMLEIVVLLLGVPWCWVWWWHRATPVAERIRKPMKWLPSWCWQVSSLVRWQPISSISWRISILSVLVVFIHNLLALATGYACRQPWGCQSATAAPSPSRWASRTRAWA